MIKAYCTDKSYDNSGKIIGYTLAEATTGQQRYIKADELKDAIIKKQLSVLNLTLTSDGRLVNSGKNKLDDVKSSVDANATHFCATSVDDLADKIIYNSLQQLDLPGEAQWRLNGRELSNNIVMRFKKGLNVDAILKYKTIASETDKGHDIDIAFSMLGIRVHNKNLEFDAPIFKLSDVLGSPVSVDKGTSCIRLSDTAYKTLGDAIVKYMIDSCTAALGKWAPVCGVNSREELNKFLADKEKQKYLITCGKWTAVIAVTAVSIVIAVLSGAISDSAASIGLANAFANGSGAMGAVGGAVAAKAIGVTGMLGGTTGIAAAKAYSGRIERDTVKEKDIWKRFDRKRR